MPSTDTPRDVLQKLIDGVSRGDWSNLAELYATDTDVRHPMATDKSSLLQGRTALADHFAEFAESGTALIARDVTWHSTDDPEVVIAEFTYDGKPGDGGEPFTLVACFVWRVRDGQILESRDYLSRPRPHPVAA